jgi:hypothetical protein
MKSNTMIKSLLFAVALGPFLFALGAAGQGTAFTYQGQLQYNGSPANGSYNMIFSLFENPAGSGSALFSTTNLGIHVSAGLFTAELDFGPGVFTGPAYWMQTQVATNGEPYSPLAPLVQLTPAPYAIYAESAGNFSGTLPSSGLSGTYGSAVAFTDPGDSFTGSGSGLTGLNASQLTSGMVPLAQLPGAVLTNNESSAALGSLTLNGALTLPAATVSQDIIYSGTSLLLYDDNSGNSFIGLDAGNITTSGQGGFVNTASGFYALFSNTTGYDNTAIGASALMQNTTGSDNTAIGGSALVQNTTGSGNMAGGGQALFSNTTGSGNTANGVEALFSNTTGYYNTAAGSTALYSNTTGEENTAIGCQTLFFNSTGSADTAAGVAALYSNTTGEENTAIGYQALFFNSTGSYNTASGEGALLLNSNGSLNTANGVGALQQNTSGNDNTAIGASALVQNTTGSGNTASGNEALNNNTNGSFNTAIGFQALYDSTDGSNNIALGYGAGDQITTGNYNIDIGNQGVAGESGIIRIGTEGSQTATYLTGTVYANGVALTSDRNAKDNFKPVDHQAVLAKVAALPVTQWNYKTDSQGVRHIGPMAQDFQAAFGLAGGDDTHISVVDEGGVALAAIQGLNEKLETQIKDKDAQIQSLQQRLERLERLVSAKPSQP